MKGDLDMRGRNKTWDSWDENHLRRKEMRHDPGLPEELPHKKKAKKKRTPRHEHKWEIHREYDWWISDGRRWIWDKCSICGKDRDRYED